MGLFRIWIPKEVASEVAMLYFPITQQIVPFLFLHLKKSEYLSIFTFNSNLTNLHPNIFSLWGNMNPVVTDIFFLLNLPI